MTTLSKQIKEGTKKAHNMVENTGFISCFLKGVVDKKSYTKLLCDLYHVYCALEKALERHKENRIMSHVYYPELYRKEAIEKDLEYFLGSDWENKITCTDSAEDYADYIRNVSFFIPELLVAHQYTRYIGDLSGGQILKGIVKTALNVDDDALNFYNFDTIPDKTKFKEQYRESLDSLPFSEEEIELVISQAIISFEMNKNIFNEIEGTLISSIGKLLFSRLTKSKESRNA